MQSDQVLNIPCGTRGGVMIYFEKVEVHPPRKIVDICAGIGASISLALLITPIQVVNKLKDEYVMDTIRNYTVNYDKLYVTPG